MYLNSRPSLVKSCALLVISTAKLPCCWGGVTHLSSPVEIMVAASAEMPPKRQVLPGSIPVPKMLIMLLPSCGPVDGTNNRTLTLET